MPLRDGVGDVVGVRGEDRVAVGQQRVRDGVQRGVLAPVSSPRSTRAASRPRAARSSNVRMAMGRRIPRARVPAQSTRGWPNTTSSSRCTAGAPPRLPSARRTSAAPASAMPLAKTLPSGPAISTPSPAREAAVHAGHADGQQRGAVLGQRALRAGVDVDAAGRRLAVAQPQLVRRDGPLVRGEARARPARRARRRARRRPRTVGDDGRDAPGARHLRGDDLGAHAAGAPARAACADLELVQQPVVGHLAHELGARLARVAGVEALLVGQQQEQPRLQQHRDLGGEGVVVAEGDLVAGGRVVLVDDRRDAPVEQRLQRAPGVDVGRAMTHVGLGQQHLRAARPGPGQRVVPRLLQQRLADGRGGLQLGHAASAARPAAAARGRGRWRPRTPRRRARRRATGSRCRGRARRAARDARARPRPRAWTSRA